jgi:hypothetical protein
MPRGPGRNKMAAILAADLKPRRQLRVTTRKVTRLHLLATTAPKLIVAFSVAAPVCEAAGGTPDPAVAGMIVCALSLDLRGLCEPQIKCKTMKEHALRRARSRDGAGTAGF